MILQLMSMEELKKEFESRKKALLEVRDEIDRREEKPSVNVDFTNYVENNESE